jgi:hypothetical protein
MGSRAYSFCRLENRLPGLGAAARLICQIPSRSLEPSSPTTPSSFHAETCVQVDTWMWAGASTYVGGHAPGCLGNTLTYRHTCICTLGQVHLYTQIQHCTCVHKTHQLYVHTSSCWSTCFNVCTCPCTYTYTDLAFYINICAHRPRHT